MLRSAAYRHKTEDLPMVSERLVDLLLFQCLPQYQVKTYANIGSLWSTLLLIIGFMFIIPLSLTGFGAKLLLKVKFFKF